MAEYLDLNGLTTYDTLIKGKIPTKTSQLTNDSGFLTSVPTATATTTGGMKASVSGTTLTLTF